MAVVAAERPLFVGRAWELWLLRAFLVVLRRVLGRSAAELAAESADEDSGVVLGSDALAPTLGLLLGSSCWADGKAEFRFI